MIDLPPYPESSLVVQLRREPFEDEFTITLPDGTSEELEAEDLRTWFKVRGADEIAVESAMDYCWNFYAAEFEIKNPKVPVQKNSNVLPQL